MTILWTLDNPQSGLTFASPTNDLNGKRYEHISTDNNIYKFEIDIS